MAWREFRRIASQAAKLRRRRQTIKDLLLRLFGQKRTLRGSAGLVLTRQRIDVAGYKVDTYHYDKIVEGLGASSGDLFPDLLFGLRLDDGDEKPQRRKGKWHHV